jgi:hypothetical protein
LCFIFIELNKTIRPAPFPNVCGSAANKTLNIQQELTYFNQSNDTLSSLILNDWNNAYSDVNTPLARRFSDEFYRGFHLAKEEERGSTTNITIINPDKLFLSWKERLKILI